MKYWKAAIKDIDENGESITNEFFVREPNKEAVERVLGRLIYIYEVDARGKRI